MKLSKLQLEELMQSKQLILSFIGMSNIGKTYWSKKLSRIGFNHINCDHLIETKLASVLKEHGYLGIKDVSAWMGQPYDDRYPTNQQKYLSLEQITMEDIFEQIKTGKMQNTVIDTTGSVVHTAGNICTELKKLSLVIYIETDENMKEKMFEEYIKNPKPVVFGDIFKPKGEDSAAQTLKRCYLELLNLRRVLYTKYADVTLNARDVRKNMDIQQFISLIKQSL